MGPGRELLWRNNCLFTQSSTLNGLIQSNYPIYRRPKVACMIAHAENCNTIMLDSISFSPIIFEGLGKVLGSNAPTGSTHRLQQQIPISEDQQQSTTHIHIIVYIMYCSIVWYCVTITSIYLVHPIPMRGDALQSYAAFCPFSCCR